jgi:hypothetical protein
MLKGDLIFNRSLAFAVRAVAGSKIRWLSFVVYFIAAIAACGVIVTLNNSPFRVKKGEVLAA